MMAASRPVSGVPDYGLSVRNGRIADFKDLRPHVADSGSSAFDSF